MSASASLPPGLQKNVRPLQRQRTIRLPDGAGDATPPAVSTMQRVRLSPAAPGAARRAKRCSDASVAAATASSSTTRPSSAAARCGLAGSLKANSTSDVAAPLPLPLPLLLLALPPSSTLTPAAFSTLPCRGGYCRGGGVVRSRMCVWGGGGEALSMSEDGKGG